MLSAPGVPPGHGVTPLPAWRNAYTVAALRFPGISCPPIAPHPRKRLACSATGGASPLSHIFFCLGKRQGELPRGQERGPWGQTCRARYKRKPPFGRLLVRPEQMGLVSSSCAKRRTLLVCSRRICPAFNNLLVQIGLLCATAPLPLSGQKKRVYAPAGRSILRMPGLAAAAQEGPRVLFAPSILHPMEQLRRKRYGRAGQGAQPETARQVIAQCSHRAVSLFFSYTGRGAFSFLEKENGGRIPRVGSGPPSGPKGAGSQFAATV